MVAVCAVALFFVLESSCIVLSLFTVVDEGFKTAYADVPKLFVLAMMLIGFIPMITFIRIPKQEADAGSKLEDPHSCRHYVHSYISLMGIMIFYFQGIVFDINNIIAGFNCQPLWSVCDNGYVIRYHVVDLLFYFVRPVFMGLECIVCYMMVFYSFAQTTWMTTYSVAVIQVANIAICFQSLVSESYHHHNSTSLEINFLSTSCWRQHHNNSWSDCPTSSNGTAECCWPEDNRLLHWLEVYNPLLYPVVIEFSLLVGEVMLGKLYKGPDTSSSDSHSDEDVGDEEEINGNDAVDNGSPDDFHLVTLNRRHLRILRFTHFLQHRWTLVVVLIVIPLVSNAINIAVASTSKDPSRPLIKLQETAIDGWLIALCLLFILHAIFYSCFISVYSSKHPSAHMSSIYYLPLFSSAGSFLLITRRFILSTVSHSSTTYILKQLAEMGQVCMQVLLLYKIAYVDLAAVMLGGKKVKIYSLLIFAFMLNITFWGMNSLSPRESYVDIEEAVEWGIFDDIVGPLNIFFRFSSMLIFVSTALYLRLSKVLPISQHSSSSQELTSINYWQEDRDTIVHQYDLRASHAAEEPDHHTSSNIIEVQVEMHLNEPTTQLLSSSNTSSANQWKRYGSFQANDRDTLL